MMLADIQASSYLKFLETQKIYRLTLSDDFQRAYSKAEKEHIHNVVSLIEKIDKQGILEWMKTVLKNDYESFNMRDLRKLAKDLNVTNYNFLSKDSLLSEISKRKNINDSRHTQIAQ